MAPVGCSQHGQHGAPPYQSSVFSTEHPPYVHHPLSTRCSDARLLWHAARLLRHAGQAQST
eukprot:1437664-Rhodomonas_salina.6